MRRRINFTRRHRLKARHVQIAVRSDPPSARPVVVASFALDDLKLPDEARIVVEAYRHAFTERLDYGTVAAPRPPRERVLEELEADGLLFRVKVVDPATGRLLALARQLRAGEEAGSRRELFRVNTRDLGQELWRVELDLDGLEPPVLLLNNRVPDIDARLRDPIFRALVLPAAMRAVLLGLWRSGAEAHEDEPPEESWVRRWHDFAAARAGEEPPDPDDDPGEMLGWIDRACANFAEEHHLVDEMMRAEAQEAGR